MPERLIAIPIEDEMRRSYLDYAMSVIIGRALPDVRDGLKPVHRRVLYAMHEMGLAWNRGYRKSARVAGDTLGKFHPHGEAPVYEALVRMAQDFSLRYPLVDGQGNFGSIDGDPPAAMRYTEVRLAKIAQEMLADIERDTVDFVPNYDETQQEPVVLPARLPNLLVNGSSGIAVGMATNIPPHNLSEIVDGMVLALDNPAVPIEELLRVVKGPDFPTRGYIYGTAGIRDAFTTGRGSITMRARAHTEKLRGGREAIVVTELPYQVNKATLMMKIAELSREGKLDGLSEIRDESDRHGIRMVLELGKGEIAQIVLNQLYKHTAMQSTFGVNMLALVGRRPQVVTLREMLDHFIDFRREVVTRRTRFDLARAEERAHILEGLRKALDHLDLVIRLIRAASSVDAAREALMQQLELSEIQAKAILDMRLQRLTQLEREKVVQEHTEVLQLIERLRAILASDALVRQIIKDEALALKAEFGDERRTEIVEETVELTLEDLIADEEMVVTVTRSGYIKRTAIEAYRSQRRGGKGVTGMETKEEDVVENVYIASTHAYLLVLHERRQGALAEGARDPRSEAGRPGQGPREPAAPRGAGAGGGHPLGAGLHDRRLRVLRDAPGPGEEDRAGRLRAAPAGRDPRDHARRGRRGHGGAGDGRPAGGLAGDPAGDGHPVRRGGGAPDGPLRRRRQGHRRRGGGHRHRGGGGAGRRRHPHRDRSGLRQADPARGVPAPGAERQGHHRHQDGRP